MAKGMTGVRIMWQHGARLPATVTAPRDKRELAPAFQAHLRACVSCQTFGLCRAGEDIRAGSGLCNTCCGRKVLERSRAAFLCPACEGSGLATRTPETT